MQLVHILLLFGTSIVFFLVAAKTHGRQVRLEREYRGIDTVDFRREVQNHPWVEELWKKDRAAYWLRAVVAFVPIALVLLLTNRVDLWAILPLSLLFAMSVAFTTQAVASQARLGIVMRAQPTPLGPTPRHEDEQWKTDARRGTVRWFAATYVSLTVAFVAVFYVLMT